MKSKLVGILIVFVVNSAASSYADEKPLFLHWLMAQAKEAPFEEMSDHRAIYTLLQIAKQCEGMKRRELADQILQRVEEIVEKSGKTSYYSQLFRYEDETKQLDLAEKYVNKAGRTKNILDRLDLVRFRLGDKDALKNYPREESDFYNAMGLVSAYIQVGDYEAVRSFVSDLKISKENDPRDVAGIAYKRIAKIQGEKGDLKKARYYADKAMLIAGNNYYTGFSIRVLHKSLRGSLLKEVDAFADRAVAYRGHHTRELLQHLIGELIVTKHFKEAKEVAKRFAKQDETDDALQWISGAQARDGKTDAARQTAKAIKNASMRNVARVEIAASLWKSGKPDVAEKLAVSIEIDAKKEAKQNEEVQQELASLYALMGRQSELQTIFDQAQSPTIHGRSILGAVTGYAESVSSTQR